MLWSRGKGQCQVNSTPRFRENVISHGATRHTRLIRIARFQVAFADQVQPCGLIVRSHAREARGGSPTRGMSSRKT